MLTKKYVILKRPFAGTPRDLSCEYELTRNRRRGKRPNHRGTSSPAR